MFISEKEMKEIFWKNYNRKGRALRYQFECPIREGAADLLTIERYQAEYQINGFEFKLTDITKALLQAEANLPYVNKSWIVIPDEKEELIQNKYMLHLKEKKHIGVMCVSAGGKFKIIYQPRFKKEVIMNQIVFKLCMVEF